MKNITFIFTLAFALMLSSCGTSIEVSYDMDRSVDFTKYKTFKIAEWNEDNSELIDEFGKQRMHEAMRIQFIKRGYTEVAENPDIVLDVFVVTNTETYTTAYTTHMGGYGAWGGYGGWYGPSYGYGYGMGVSNTQFVEHEKLLGTIVLDVYDERARKLVWQGVGRGEVNKTERPTQSSVNSTFEKIYYKYPVRKR